MTEQEKKDFEWASSYYLYDEIEKLAWQPFEHWQGEQIYNEIEKLADGVRKYIKENK